MNKTIYSLEVQDPKTKHWVFVTADVDLAFVQKARDFRKEMQSTLEFRIETYFKKEP